VDSHQSPESVCGVSSEVRHKGKIFLSVNQILHQWPKTKTGSSNIWHHFPCTSFKSRSEVLFYSARLLYEDLYLWIQLKYNCIFRYGLPVNFQAVLMQPHKKQQRKLKETLNSMYAHLDGTAAMGQHEVWMMGLHNWPAIINHVFDIFSFTTLPLLTQHWIDTRLSSELGRWTPWGTGVVPQLQLHRSWYKLTLYQPPSHAVNGTIFTFLPITRLVCGPNEACAVKILVACLLDPESTSKYSKSSHN